MSHRPVGVSWAFLVVALTVLPAQAVASPSLSLRRRLSYSIEESYQSDELWDPVDWMGYTGAGNEDGVSIRSNGGLITAKASTMSFMSPVAVWMIGSSTEAYDLWKGYDFLEIVGPPGSRGVVSLEYTLDSYHVNMAFDGYSGGSSEVTLGYGKLTETWSGWATETIITHKDYYFAGLMFDSDIETGSVSLGEMAVGDVVAIRPEVRAYVKTTHYYAGFVASAMVSSFDYTVNVTELPPDLPPDSEPRPIPAPAALLLTTIGASGVLLLKSFRLGSVRQPSTKIGNHG